MIGYEGDGSDEPWGRNNRGAKVIAKRAAMLFTLHDIQLYTLNLYWLIDIHNQRYRELWGNCVQ